MAIRTELEWRGSDEEQRVARTVFEVMMLRGLFFADTIPINQSLEALAEYLRSQKLADGDAAEVLHRSLAANSQVFALDGAEDGATVSTTRAGVPPVVLDDVPNVHTYANRLFENSREPTPDDLISVRGILRDIPDMYGDDSDFDQIIGASMIFTPDLEDEVGALTPETDVQVGSTLRVGDAVLDVSLGAEALYVEHGDAFKELLGAYLREDFRFVQFGDEFYVEDRLERLSKGQLRDIKDYIAERNQPLTDEEILSDALRRPLANADYNLWRFTINYRLSREKKDFRFVGAGDDRLWTASSLPALGQSYRKPAEIAQDYRYQADPSLSDQDVVIPAGGAGASGKLELRHTLTWYESENGVLPVGLSTQLLVPDPLLEDQSVVVLRIQDPQNFASYLAELRIGAGSRGSYIAGLDEMFQSTLVPGAVFSLVQGDGSNQFTIEYDRKTAQESRLLQWDLRRERWFFAPIVYECPVDPAYLLTEDRIGKLDGAKRAVTNDQRRPEALLAGAFDVIGEQGDDGALTALLDDLLPVVNIERPFSKQYLESLIDSPQYPQFGFEDDSVGLAYYRK